MFSWHCLRMLGLPVCLYNWKFVERHFRLVMTCEDGAGLAVLRPVDISPSGFPRDGWLFWALVAFVDSISLILSLRVGLCVPYWTRRWATYHRVWSSALALHPTLESWLGRFAAWGPDCNPANLFDNISGIFWESEDQHTHGSIKRGNGLENTNIWHATW